MPFLIDIIPKTPSQIFSLEIEDRIIVFSVKWNTRARFFTVDIKLLFDIFEYIGFDYFRHRGNKFY